MSRMLTNLKFWALTATLAWIVVVTAVITMNPEYALGAR
ncbi:hypothetical protein FHU38_004298 [Saccharomonospora amisosensis]|uniref:Uncharacterized protein n=1 Tax=Saccharomonospora amisosensis TaxID=1128677 RepID=A0A7X5UTH3_9PSEU|nr:hypothetical protein [Saccharomonospora amisosensis]